MTPIEPAQNDLPRGHALLRSYPNPFNSGTRVNYRVMQSGRIQLWVYDRLGRKVQCLADAWHGAGAYQLPVSAAGLSSGIYFCVLLDAQGARAVEKLVLVR